MDDDASDEVLLARTRAGDEAAFAELYRRHQQAARRYARRVSSPWTDANDITAEAFCKVLSAIRNGRGPVDGFRRYLLAAVRTAGISQAGRGRDLPLPDLEPGDRRAAFAERSAESSVLVEAFARLPPRWREVLWLSEVEQRSLPDVAGHLGLTRNATSALAMRAREGLRQAYLAAHVDHRAGPPHDTVLAHLPAYVRRRLGEGDRVAVDEHVAGCATCRAALADLTRLAELLGPAR